MLLIPAIDIRDGGCVRLYQGDFEQVTRYTADPVELAQRYATLGAPWLHLVDLDGAASGKPVILGLASRIRETTAISLQLGGGLRSEDAVRAALGIAQRVVIGSLAVTDPKLVERWLQEFGGDRIALALDVKLDSDGSPHVTTHGWTEDSTLTLWAAIDRYRPHGLRHVLCTDVARDGALAGPNVELYEECCRRAPDIVVQASGGVRDVGDLSVLAATGTRAVISGKALLEGRISDEELEPFLQDE
jgi:phosphoribosylformimino-5-aminoimidazole carboxamide ribotide isomerase